MKDFYGPAMTMTYWIAKYFVLVNQGHIVLKSLAKFNKLAGKSKWQSYS